MQLEDQENVTSTLVKSVVQQREAYLKYRKLQPSVNGSNIVFPTPQFVNLVCSKEQEKDVCCGEKEEVQKKLNEVHIKPNCDAMYDEPCNAHVMCEKPMLMTVPPRSRQSMNPAVEGGVSEDTSIQPMGIAAATAVKNVILCRGNSGEEEKRALSESLSQPAYIVAEKPCMFDMKSFNLPKTCTPSIPMLPKSATT